MIRKAEKRKSKLRLALMGPTNSGKTFSAIQLAMGLGGRIGLIDTENGSGDLYSDLTDYDIIPLTAPYTVEKYRNAIREFEDAGHDIIIVDSLSHAWAGDGGLLDKQAQVAKSTGNSYTAWGQITPEHQRLIDQMLASKAHIIATVRVKMAYVLEKNDKGRDVPRKVGLQPVFRDGIEYEFTVVLDIDTDHMASASKDRTRVFDGWHDHITPRTGKVLLDWLNKGEAPVTMPPKRTRKDAIAELYPRLMAVTTDEELDTILAEPEVKWLIETSTNGAALELSGVLAEARDKLNKVEEELGAAGEP